MSIGSIPPISPLGTVTLAGSTTSTAAQLPAAGDTVLIYNASAATAFVALGAAGGTPVAAVAGGFPVPAGGSRILSAGPQVGSVAVVLASGTGSVYASSCNGVHY